MLKCREKKNVSNTLREKALVPPEKQELMGRWDIELRQMAGLYDIWGFCITHNEPRLMNFLHIHINVQLNKQFHQ
ncbi:MAG: hypothetical protein ACKOC0_05350 [Cytophagales bacterium]